ncbi:MAG: diguanylate cyclase [Sphingobacteriia bacterium]|nr:diguanylate cyclase [Sphingobacteriia bacterium]
MDYNDAILNEIKQINLIDHLCDYARIVDPLLKKISYSLKAYGNLPKDRDSFCYNIWGKDQPCENCISVKAYNDNVSYVKIEYYADQVLMATAVPLVLDGRKIVLELLKDITKSGIIDIEGQEIGEIHNIITNRNKSVIRDSLTGTYNYNFIFERLPEDVSKCNEEHTSLTIIFTSINDFTYINNTWGFKAGNYVIKEFSNIIRSYCHDPRDWVARYGGTQFILVLFHTDENKAYQICKQINKKVTQSSIRFAGKEIKFNINLGQHTILNQSITPDDFIKEAVNKLYIANEPINIMNNEKISQEIVQRYLLTMSEHRVASLVLDGLTNTEIAKQLYVSSSTVKKHISSVFHKFNVKSRAEFISKFKHF